MRRELFLSRSTALVTLLLALSACSTNPVTGRRELVFMSPEREAALGAQAAEQVAQQIGLVDDPALSAYVEALGQQLATHSPRTDVAYHFAVADMPEPNAFALPGGWIYVSRGLLAICNSETELANVIGHEIGHVAARHSAQRETRSMGVGLLSVLGTIAAGVAGGAEAAQAAAQIGQAAGAGLIASYGRDQERQADKVGQDLAAAAGWDPFGMPDFLDTLGQSAQLVSGQPRRPSFLDSHPMTAERVQNTRAYAERLPVAPIAPLAGSQADFFALLEGLLLGADPAQGLFEGPLFLHPDLDLALQFPPGWATQNSAAAVAARAPDGGAMLLLEGQGEAGDPAAAARAFAQANQLQLLGGVSGRVGSWPVYRARARANSQQGELGLDLTWLGHPAGLFRVTGMAPLASFQTHADTFSETSRSLRPLSAQERAGIRERRLEVVRARAGESLSALSRRSANVWSLEETAVSNDLEPTQKLEGGALVKIAVEVPYRSSRPSSR